MPNYPIGLGLLSTEMCVLGNLDFKVMGTIVGGVLQLSKLGYQKTHVQTLQVPLIFKEPNGVTLPVCLPSPYLQSKPSPLGSETTQAFLLSTQS